MEVSSVHFSNLHSPVSIYTSVPGVKYSETPASSFAKDPFQAPWFSTIVGFRSVNQENVREVTQCGGGKGRPYFL